MAKNLLNSPSGNRKILMSAPEIKKSIQDHLTNSIGSPPSLASKQDYYKALALTVRDRLQQHWVETVQTYLEQNLKGACYLSAEFLMGPHLGNNLLNLGIEREARQAVAEMGFDLDELLAEEEEPGLGNGGLGRLDACYLDSLATLERLALGYGIRYEFGIFDQEIRDGWQCEITDINVQNGQLIYPAADLSEQISMAGKEASGTGNMKFTLNGALTIGTLDGANVEIRQEVGEENFFLFGLTTEETVRLLNEGYRPYSCVERNPELEEAIQLIASGHFSNGDTDIFRPLVDNLCQHDPFLVFADYAYYVACQDKVAGVWADPENWTRMSILNTARAGKFSSDRAIREYCDEIWEVRAAPIN